MRLRGGKSHATGRNTGGMRMRMRSVEECFMCKKTFSTTVALVEHLETQHAMYGGARAAMSGAHNNSSMEEEEEGVQRGSERVEYVIPDPHQNDEDVMRGGDRTRTPLTPCPVFYPTAEEFADPLAYISGIADVGRQWGICRIVPPSSVWHLPKTPIPPPLDPDNMQSFRTKLQNIHQLKHRNSRAEAFFRSYEKWQSMKSYVLPVPPVLEQCAVDLWDLLCSVINLYNLKQENVNRETQCNWPAVLDHYLKRSLLSGRAMVRAWGPMQPNDPAFRLRATKLRSVFERYLAEYEDDAWAHPFDAYEGLSDDEIRSFGYAEGALQTVDSFKEKAEETARQLMLKDTPLAELEQLYWNILESRDTRMVVEYANDLSVVTYGSGFPRDEHEPMSRHPWNLNVLPKLPSSLFHHAKEVIHGVTDPMLYFGGVFTSFAWHVEDHFLYSINYHHGGAPKVWYGVGSDHAEALERAMKAELPELFDRHPDLLHQLVTMLSPAALVRRGVPVCTAVQEPGDFVITFPRGYHSGWNAGFNLAEAVNFAMPDWLVWGVRSLDNYIKTRRMCAFSHEELILSCAQSFPVSYVARHLLQELYRLTLNYDELRRRVHVGGVRLMFKAEKCGDILHCTKCLADCYFACIQCHCSKQERVCLRCCNEGRVDWCTGHCQGLFLFERVPMEVLESLIQKLETRLTLPAICSLRRSESVDIFSAQLNYVNRVSAKGAAGVTSKAVSLDIPMARPASLRSKLARRGGVMSLTPQQEATLRCPDSAAVRLPTLFFVEDRLRIRRRVEGVAKAVFADHSPALIPPRNEDNKHHHYLSHQSASSSGNPESDDVLVKASPAKETSAKRTAPEDDSATRLMPSPRADTKRRVVIDLTCDD